MPGIAATSTVRKTSKPSYDDLRKRVAELERQLSDLRSSAIPAPPSIPPPLPELSEIDSSTVLQDVIDAVPAFALLITVEGKVVMLNKATTTRFGQPFEAIEGRMIQELVPEGFAALLAERIREAAALGAPVHFEREEIDRHDHYSICPIRDIHGRIRLLVIIGIDITRRKQTENSLKESEARFRTLFEEAPIAIQGYTADGTIHYWNRANEAVYGYRREEALGRNLVDLIVPPEIREFAIDLIRQGVETRQMPEAAELLLMRKDGSRVPVYSSHVMFQPAKAAPELYCLDIDLTGLKQVQEQLEQKYRLESIGTIAQGIASDFNTLLDIIIANTDLAVDQVPKKNPAHACMQEISAAGMRAKAIVRQFERFSHKNAHLSSVNIVPVVEDTLRLLQVTLPSTIDIRQVLDTNQAWVLADPHQIRQMLINLVGNAALTMEQTGGTIAIQVAGRHLAVSDHTFPELSPGSYIAVTISDTGPGLPKDIVDHLFDSHFAAGQALSGTGIGLSAVKGIVNHHNGGIRVESEIARGTRFDILLPENVGRAD
jgi:PAS domain S-box-containing protein